MLLASRRGVMVFQPAVVEGCFAIRSGKESQIDVDIIV